MLEQKNYDPRDNAFREIDSLRFPIINVRRTSNLAVAPVNTFGMAMGLFMLSLPLTGWCDFRSPTLATALMFGGWCEYIIGIYDWYQGKTVLCFIDFIFGLLHLLIYYSFRLCEYEITPVSERFESYLYGTFFTLYLVVLLALIVACKGKGIFHIVNLGLLVFADIFIMIWQFRYKRDKEDRIKGLKQTAGYILFFSSITIWFTGVGRLINDIFQKDIIPMIKPDL